jgi:hypothetical protein
MGLIAGRCGNRRADASLRNTDAEGPMRILPCLTAAQLTAALLAAAPVAAQQSTMIYQYKHWEVEYVVMDDGTQACIAEVDAGTDSFSIWYFQDDTFRIQFYSTDWSFGEGTYADVMVRIDRRSPWNISDAELYKNSVLINLPGDERGFNFLSEVARGNSLYLGTADGQGIKSYSLAGSRASMDAMAECGGAISNSPSNPFN